MPRRAGSATARLARSRGVVGPPSHHDYRELDTRTEGTLEVVLLWHPINHHLVVVVHETRCGDSVIVPVPHGHHPIDVFHDPFAYAGMAHSAA